jgi:NADPH-dependent 2,4-dienoyl-CoA reductase/sulfur reductase-like enzyme
MTGPSGPDVLLWALAIGRNPNETGAGGWVKVEGHTGEHPADSHATDDGKDSVHAFTQAWP